MRSGPFDLAINRRRQSLALRPFLQNRFRIAQRANRFTHPFGPVSLHELGRSGVATVQEHRTDHCFADIPEHRIAQPRARASAHRSELDGFIQPERLGNIGAGFAAHQIGETLRQLSFVRFRERPIEHVRDDQTQDVIAEELQPLIAVASANGLQCRDMSKSGRQQRRIGERVPDPLLDNFCGSLRARPARLFLRRLGLYGAGTRGVVRTRRHFDDCGVAAHRTMEKMRFQRTETGQRQNCQACSPSAMEKKIICARPIRFSDGT